MHPRSFSKALIPDYNAAEFDKEYSGFACSLHNTSDQTVVEEPG
jgi:hypothetical protein